MTSLLVSLAVVAGIFVAGLTNSRVLPAAKAQGNRRVALKAHGARLAGTVIAAKGVIVNGVASDVLIPGSVRISNGVVDSGCGLTALGNSPAGDIVYALGVFTSGNLTGGDVVVSSSGVFTSGNIVGGDEPISPSGVFTSGNDNGGVEPIGPSGVFTSGNDNGEVEPISPSGVFTSGNDGGEVEPISPSGVFTSGNVYVGDNLQIVGGVLSGSDIQIIDGVVSGSNLQVTGGYVTSGCGN